MTRVLSPLRFLLLSALALGFLCAMVQEPAQAATKQGVASQEMRLTSFRLSEDTGTLVLNFGVGVTQIDQLKVMLKEGVQVELTCDVQLSRPRTYWFRKTLAETSLTSHLSYDTLTKEYFLMLPSEQAPHRNKSLRRLLSGAWKALTLPVASTSLLIRGEEYRVTLDVALINTDIPEWLTKSFFFWSWDPAPPIQYSTDFTY